MVPLQSDFELAACALLQSRQTLYGILVLRARHGTEVQQTQTSLASLKALPGSASHAFATRASW